jgi:hypothetical protein
VHLSSYYLLEGDSVLLGFNSREQQPEAANTTTAEQQQRGAANITIAKQQQLDAANTNTAEQQQLRSKYYSRGATT